MSLLPLMLALQLSQEELGKIDFLQKSLDDAFRKAARRKLRNFAQKQYAKLFSMSSGSFTKILNRIEPHKFQNCEIKKFLLYITIVLHHITFSKTAKN